MRINQSARKDHHNRPNFMRIARNARSNEILLAYLPLSAATPVLLLGLSIWPLRFAQMAAQRSRSLRQTWKQSRALIRSLNAILNTLTPTYQGSRAYAEFS